MIDFNTLPLPDALKKALEKMNFTTPTQIQADSLPHALEGKDVLGSSQTGSGKTGAYSIPLIAKLINNNEERALIMAPTRELAMQVYDFLGSLVPANNNIRRALLIGGEPMFKQIQQLKRDARIIVGTPGRINDHIKRGLLNVSQTRFLVLDETDRMLDIGMGEQIETIIARMPKQRQTLMFSATFSPNIIKISQKYLIDPVRVSVGVSNAVATKIVQETVNIDHSKKYSELTRQLENRTGSVIIFVKTKMGADKLASRLDADNHAADAIHGDLHQRKREKVINAFRNKNYRILVATDVAARGLDIPHIEHVINYDLPQCPEDYIHRIGRTARAGAEGNALSFISPDERGKWRAIAKLINPNEKLSPEFENATDAPRRKRSFGGKKFGSERGFGGGNGFNGRREGGNGGGNGYERREGGGYRGNNGGGGYRGESGGARNDNSRFGRGSSRAA